MNLKKLIIISIYFFITVFLWNTAFWYTWNINNSNNKTIKELHIEAIQLNKEQKQVNQKRLELQKLLIKSWFIKDNLNIKAKLFIKNIIEWYKLERKKLESLLLQKSNKLKSTKEIKLKLINLKKNLYSNLVPYIKENKLKDYLEFVKKDLFTSKEYRDIKADSIKTNIILKEKINNIKEKILEHKRKTREILKKFILKKIDLKINLFKNNDNFKKLPLEKKEKIINYIIKRINEKIDKMINIENKTDILETKIEIYEIVRDKFIKLKKDIEL